MHVAIKRVEFYAKHGLLDMHMKEVMIGKLTRQQARCDYIFPRAANLTRFDSFVRRVGLDRGGRNNKGSAAGGDKSNSGDDGDVARHAGWGGWRRTQSLRGRPSLIGEDKGGTNDRRRKSKSMGPKQLSNFKSIRTFQTPISSVSPSKRQEKDGGGAVIATTGGGVTGGRSPRRA